MEKTSEILIYLMKCSLQNTKPEEAPLARADLEALLRLAGAHSVSAMVCMALEKTTIFAGADDAVKKHWREAKNKAILQEGRGFLERPQPDEITKVIPGFFK